MKKFVVGLIFTLGLYFHLASQIMDVTLGMTEEQVLLHANPREFNNGFELVKEGENSFTFANRTNPNYEIQVEFTLKDKMVNVIKTTHIARNDKFSKSLIEYYQQSVADYESDPTVGKNEGIAEHSKKSFRAYRPLAEAFTDPEMRYLCVFMYYHKGTEVVFTKMERSFY